jgi:hypothetical protein
MLARRDVLKGVIVAATSLRLQQAEAQQAKLKVSGEVLTRDNKPIPSVLVTAYRTKEKIGEATSGGDGRYVLEYTKDSTIDTLKYERTGYIPGVVDDLSGARDQTIYKVLNLATAKLSIFEAQEGLSALERIYFTDVGPSSPVGKLREIYGATLEKMQVPTELNERKKVVMRLYGFA